jgi:hypothetical protein
MKLRMLVIKLRVTAVVTLLLAIFYGMSSALIIAAAVHGSTGEAKKRANNVT